MVKTEPKIESGKSLLELLDRRNVNVTAFFWFYLPESNSWRLVISARLSDDKDIEHSYENFIKQFGNENYVKEIGLSNITIIPDSDNLLNLLKNAIITDPKAIAGIRFTSNVINGILIEDAYIYRLS